MKYQREREREDPSAAATKAGVLITTSTKRMNKKQSFENGVIENSKVN